MLTFSELFFYIFFIEKLIFFITNPPYRERVYIVVEFYAGYAILHCLLVTHYKKMVGLGSLLLS